MIFASPAGHNDNDMTITMTMKWRWQWNDFIETQENKVML